MSLELRGANVLRRWNSTTAHAISASMDRQSCRGEARSESTLLVQNASCGAKLCRCDVQLSTQQWRRNRRRLSEPHVPAVGRGALPVDTPRQTRGLTIDGDTSRFGQEQGGRESQLSRRRRDTLTSVSRSIHASGRHNDDDINAARNLSTSRRRHGRLVRVV